MVPVGVLEISRGILCKVYTGNQYIINKTNIEKIIKIKEGEKMVISEFYIFLSTVLPFPSLPTTNPPQISSFS